MQKAAIVTGSTKGIGKSIAIKLLYDGYFVYINYFHDNKAANALEKYLNYIGFRGQYKIIKADVSSKKGINDFINAIDFKRYEIRSLVLNAASNGKNRNEFKQISEEELVDIFKTNVFGPFFFVQAIADLLADEGSIIFISSHVGLYPHSTYIPYGLTKATEIALSKMLVKEFEKRRITVNAVAPAFIETEMFPGNRTEEHLKSICSKIAVHRFGRTEEVADLVYCLINNRYINGSVFSIDGGYDYK